MADTPLQEATVRGFRWLAMMRIVSESIGLLAVVALARLVSPAAFGRAAIALIFIMIGSILTFEGFASALVQKPTVTEDDQRAAMLMSILGGLALSLLVYGLVGPVWTPLFGARTAWLIKLVSPTLFISALGSVSRANLWRRLDFRTSSGVDAIALLIGSAASVALAIYGDGGTAIVLGGIVQTTLTTLLLGLVARPPLPRWSRASQRAISSFGIPSALAGLAGVTFSNIDYVILAARLPATTVGLYYRAFNISVVYQDKLSRIMTQMAFPVYARSPSREHLRAFHERVARAHATVIVPFLASIAALAPILVPLVFGEQWRPAVPATEILALAGCMAGILTGYPQIMLAIGKPRPLFFFIAAIAVGYGTAVLLASSHGLVVVACTVSGFYVLILIGVYHFLLRPNLGLTALRLLPELGPAIVGAIGLVAVDVGLRTLLAGAPSAVIVLLAGPTGLLVYALLVRQFFPAGWNDLIAMATRVAPEAGRTLVRLRRGSGDTGGFDELNDGGRRPDSAPPGPVSNLDAPAASAAPRHELV